jgi:hypothetical protein
MLQKASTGVNPHYFDVWQPAHHDKADAAERLVSIPFFLTEYLLCSYLTQYFVGPIYGGVEEGPWARATRPKDGPLKRQCCICCGQRYPAWTVSEYINYCLKLNIVSL